VVQDNVRHRTAFWQAQQRGCLADTSSDTIPDLLKRLIYWVSASRSPVSGTKQKLPDILAGTFQNLIFRLARFNTFSAELG